MKSKVKKKKKSKQYKCKLPNLGKTFMGQLVSSRGINRALNSVCD